MRGTRLDNVQPIGRLTAMLALLLRKTEQFRRDLRMVVRGLSGNGPSPVIRMKPMLVKSDDGGA